MAFALLLKIDQGATFRQRVTWQTGSPALPVNLTGYTATMQIRPDIASAIVYASLTTANLGIVLGGAAGTIDMFIAAVATVLFTWTDAVYDLDLTAPNGDVTRLVGGAVLVSPGVTR